jgi:hypothetical protein
MNSTAKLSGTSAIGASSIAFGLHELCTQLGIGRNKIIRIMKRLLMILTVMLSTTMTIMAQKMYITIDGRTETVTLANNSATQALVAKLQEASVTVTLNSSGGFEIWGALGFSLPTSNEQVNAQPGDIVLYNGNNICIFYGTNSWNYTRLGKIDGLSESDLRTFLKAGESNISVTLSLTSGTTAIQSARSTSDKDTYYSLNGQKVTNPSHGVYIKNGKKVRL